MNHIGFTQRLLKRKGPRVMEYSANAEIKQAMERAHEARGQILKAGLAWLFRTPSVSLGLKRVSRWA